MSKRAVASAMTFTLALAGACGSSSSPVVTPTPPSPAAPTPVAKPPPAAPPVASVDERLKALNALLTEQWEYTLAHAPEFATMVGDHRYDDKWSDYSIDAIAADLAKTRDFLTRLEAIDTTGFPEQRALDKELMVHDLREQLDNARFENWSMPIDQMSGWHLRFPQLVQLIRFETVADYENYLTRLRTSPSVFDQLVQRMKYGAAKHLVPPRYLLEKCVAQARDLASGKPEASPFARPLAAFPKTISKADQVRLRAAILEAIAKNVQPAYAAFTAYLAKEYVPAGRSDPGLWALPDGAARYAAQVASSTTTALSPDEIHAIGVAEVNRIEADELVVAKQLGFPDLASLRKHVAGDKKLYAKNRADILARYEKYTAQMYDKLPQLFGRLPKQKMLIRQTESFREQTASAAEYQQGTPDGSRPGAVEVNTYEPTKRLMLDAETTAYHEGVPGHHLQIAIQQELGDLPPFRQQGGYTAFAEGWALYSEALGREVGFYQDPWSLFGHLEDDMLRAIRLVVDTGVHSKKWTRDQVVAYFHDHSAFDEVDVQNETDRYIAWPGQALGYKIGQLTIKKLRTEAEAKLGSAFDIRAFHDEVLGAGALPMDVLERRVRAWIAARAKGA